ncbi:MAG: PAS domain S-box protein [Acidobacteria bacterium]|nr:PAS domain S-box protein [Acidobacteriota bacterium]
MALRWAMETASHGTLPFVTFFPAVMLSALLWGWRMGSLATVLSCGLVAYYLMPPNGNLRVSQPGDQIGLLIFLISGVGASLLAEIRARQREDVAISGKELALRRKNAELTKAEEQLALVLENVRQYAILMLDAEGRLAGWNVGAGRMYGYESLDVLGRGVDLLYPPETGLVESRRLLDTAAREGTARFEGWHVRKDGSRIWVHTMVTAQREDDGRLRGFSKVTRDATAEREAQLNLQASQALYRTLFERSPQGVALVNAQGRMIKTNVHLQQLFGYSEAELSGQSVEILIPEESRLVHIAARTNFMAAPAARLMGRDLTFEAMRKDGSTFLVEVALAPVNVDTEKLVMAIVQDVTLRKRAEDAIRGLNTELEARVATQTAARERVQADLERFFDLSANLVFIAGFDGYYKQVNPAFERLLGWSSAELTATPFIEIVHPDDAAATAAAGARLQAGESVVIENRTRSRDGAFHWIQWSCVSDVEQRLVYGTGSDVTAHRHWEQQLHQIEWLLTQRHEPRAASTDGSVQYETIPTDSPGMILSAVGQKALVDIMGDCLDLLETSATVYESDGSHALHALSSEWCRYLHDASRKLCGKVDDATAAASGRWLCHESCWTNLGKAAIEGGQPVDIACNGGIRLYALPVAAAGATVGSIHFAYGDPPRDSQTLKELAARYDVPVEQLRQRAESYESRPPFIIELARRRLAASARLLGEMIERRRAEEESTRLNARLERRAIELRQANEELESFSYSVSHDLRAPLRHVQGFLNLLLQDRNSKLSETGLRYASTISKSCDRLGLLIDELLALSRMSRTEPRLMSVNVADVARETIRLLVIPDDHVVNWTVAEPPMVNADPSMIRLVLTNLLDNAVKYSRRRQPAEIEIGYSGNEQGRAVLFVRDNGAGFDMRYREKLFGVFQRLHREDEFEGTGIGLATVLRVISRHGGRVWAEGAVDQGATFYFTLELSSQ